MGAFLLLSNLDRILQRASERNAQDMNRIGRSQVVPSDPIIDEIRQVRHRISENAATIRSDWSSTT